MNLLRVLLIHVPILMLSISPGFSQTNQALEEKHGFQDILLDDQISSYPGLGYKKDIRIKKSEKPVKLYIREKGYYDRIGDVRIKKLEVKTFLGIIIEISIITEKNPDIMKALKSLYGEPNYSVRANFWEWQSEGVILGLRAEGKNKLIIVYSSRKFNQYIVDDKNEDIDKISTDF